MLCTVCGNEINEGASFCTNCGAAVPVENEGAFSLDLMNDGSTSVVSQDDEVSLDNLGASLEAAVEANMQTMESIESRAQAQVDEAFKDFPPVEEEQPEASAGYADADAEADQSQPAAEGGTDTTAATAAAAAGVAAGAAATAAAGAAAAASAGVPFYQQDVSPNAHYSSQRAYGDGNAYGQNAAQTQYQPPSYGQTSRQYQDSYAQPGYQQQYQQQYQQPAYGQTQPQEQMWADSSTTTRAFAMVLYISGLIGMIIGLCVRDRYDTFITHHLNNVVVIFIGSIIGTMLCIVGIGFLILLYLFVMTIMGMVSAYNGDMKELPLIGKIHIIK